MPRLDRSQIYRGKFLKGGDCFAEFASPPRGGWVSVPDLPPEAEDALSRLEELVDERKVLAQRMAALKARIDAVKRQRS